MKWHANAYVQNSAKERAGQFCRGRTHWSENKYKYKSQGEYNKNPSRLDAKEELEISKAIEKTAKKIINEIMSTALEENSDESK